MEKTIDEILIQHMENVLFDEIRKQINEFFRVFLDMDCISKKSFRYEFSFEDDVVVEFKDFITRNVRLEIASQFFEAEKRFKEEVGLKVHSEMHSDNFIAGVIRRINELQLKGGE